jgi:hypothetical protein
MSKRHGAREQKRLAKQKAKKHSRKRELARQNSNDPTVLLKATDRWPIVATLVPKELWTNGIGNLIVARRMPDHRLACGFFLVDVFCLGIKDAHWQILGAKEFDDTRKQIEKQERLQDVPPEYFAKLIYRAAEYAKTLGFAPHRDFRHAQLLLAGIDPSQCPDEFEFGQHGRPFYVRGPYDSLDKAHSIAKQIAAFGGDYMVGIDISDSSAAFGEFEDFDELDSDDDDDIDDPDEDDFIGIRFHDVDEAGTADSRRLPPPAGPTEHGPDRYRS